MLRPWPVRFPPNWRCGGSFWNLQFLSPPLLHGRLSWNLQWLLDIGAQSRSLPDLCDFHHGGAMGARHLKAPISISSLITWPIMLKLLNDTGHWCAESLSPSFCDFLLGGAVGARLLKSSISISFLITWPTKLKLCRIILDVGAHSRSVPDIAISSQGRCKGAPLEIFKSIHTLQFLSDWTETW